MVNGLPAMELKKNSNSRSAQEVACQARKAALPFVFLYSFNILRTRFMNLGEDVRASGSADRLLTEVYSFLSGCTPTIWFTLGMCPRVVFCLSMCFSVVLVALIKGPTFITLMGWATRWGPPLVAGLTNQSKFYYSLDIKGEGDTKQSTALILVKQNKMGSSKTTGLKEFWEGSWHTWEPLCNQSNTTKSLNPAQAQKKILIIICFRPGLSSRPRLKQHSSPSSQQSCS